MVQTSADPHQASVPCTCLSIPDMTSASGLGKAPSENWLSANNPPCKLLVKTDPSLKQYETQEDLDEEQLAQEQSGAGQSPPHGHCEEVCS